ncbi:hypothetical protein PTRG_07769 [Pyrenophora tritici-repentis Pt-1C-BFP]|uniref:DUF726-domain-containing protein n=1 Tax=Pyrenophora tritici-repentis (strain Pt-1C-BFP) TaxID=426418 RepID=B2WCR0_PYRTR|nr:uncharacterized protein PTRG_07769 [Pyrenophora tritici-repentis Pt-1C-BFP]EDU50688.1 hypothetical protein PTRG_07769 [Pyrenophora tritici-repentis Pt-1C-BFP]
MSENPAAPPKHEGNSKESAESKKEPIEGVEYDDFGLPIRKRRLPTPVDDSSDSEGEGDKFQDAVASAGASREDVSMLDKSKEPTKEEKDTLEKLSETMADKPEADSNAQPHVNGQAKEPVEKAEQKESGDKPAEPKQDMADSKPPLETTEPYNSATAATSYPHRTSLAPAAISEYSHQHTVTQAQKPAEGEFKDDDDGEWQEMPAYAHYDMYDDDNRLIAKENAEELEDMSGYGNVGGAAKGYTRVIMDDDADSQTSMDDNTAYLFKERSTALADEDEEGRDPLAQMQATKNLLTEGQRVAYVGLVRLAMVEMNRKFSKFQTQTNNKSMKKLLEMQAATTKMWSQKIMVKIYGHMDINASEQLMIEQLSEHGVVPADLTPALMRNARVKNPAAEDTDTVNESDSARPSMSSPRDSLADKSRSKNSSVDLQDDGQTPPPPAYKEHEEVGFDYPEVKSPSELPKSKNLDIDLRWTVLCDLFLVLIADSVYDSRSRELFEQVGKYLSVDWLETCRFEKRVTDALEMQEQADKENWNEDEHMANRAKRSRNKRIAFMGLATVGGGLVIGLSAGLLAPVIGAGLAAGFTTIGVAGTSSFLAGAGGAAIITSTGVVTGSTVGVRAMDRRTGNVKTFEYRPLHNNKRTHLIITLAGWMNGKVDDVRLPYSTVDPIMGDIYSVLWEPDMLRSMGATINILATEALTQGLQQVLGSTILTTLMAAMTLPLALTKLSYLIDNPWIVSQARADMAGLILADSLIDRNLGTRPVTLVGFSLGSRVIFSCLKELAKRGAFGIVQNVYMFGTPAVAKHDEYMRARSVVPGRFVNGYATNDWILGYLFRATSGGVMRVAGLAPVHVPTIENVNVTEFVPRHMAYRAAMPKLLREVGWLVESDEFVEIEDPDPENHELWQRELINEIEEARKELEKKAQEKEKKGGKLSWWKKKKADKKEWEVYDEQSSALPAHKRLDQDQDPAKLAETQIMFDIDAIRKEVAALAAESKEYNAEAEFEIKEIKSTLPPMKIDMATVSPSTLRETKSYNDSLGDSGKTTNGSAAHKPALTTMGGAFEEYDEFDDPGAGSMEMTFDTSFHDDNKYDTGYTSKHKNTPSLALPPSVAASSRPKSPLPLSPLPAQPSRSGATSPWGPSSRAVSPRWSPEPAVLGGGVGGVAAPWDDEPFERPRLRSSKTEPASGALLGGGDLGKNAWADEFDDEFGGEKEMKMSFM